MTTIDKFDVYDVIAGYELDKSVILADDTFTKKQVLDRLMMIEADRLEALMRIQADMIAERMKANSGE